MLCLSVNQSAASDVPTWCCVSLIMLYNVMHSDDACYQDGAGTEPSLRLPGGLRSLLVEHLQDSADSWRRHASGMALRAGGE